jgi:predicted acylesterase/phospholipase RssA
MLTIQSARRRRAGGKLGVALAGGGPLGAFYELGVLHALGEALLGRQLTELDVYVGVSSGSFLAASLANGVDTTSMGTSFIYNEGPRVLTPEMFLQPALGDYKRRIARLPTALAAAATQFARDPLGSGWQTLLGALAKIAPTAAFDNRPLESYLHEAYSSGGHTDDFRRLRARLYVVATRLSTGESVAFGDVGYDRVPISRAVVASAALPGLYPAVEIDGRHYVDGALIRTMHASLALEAGCDLVICVNPLVPFDATHAHGRSYKNLAEEGLPAILGQTFRALIHSRMQVGMNSYRARFPNADTLLLEPDRRDETLFFTNVFRYAGRHRLVDHAYRQTRRDLLAQADTLAALLRRHGLRLNMQILRDRHRSFSTAARERAQRARQACRRLDRALGRLERLVVPAMHSG